jgi:hypothetical protein
MSAALLNSGTVGVEEAVELDEGELVGLAVVGVPSAPSFFAYKNSKRLYQNPPKVFFTAKICLKASQILQRACCLIFIGKTFKHKTQSLPQKE